MTHFAARQFLGAVHARRKEQAGVLIEHVRNLLDEIDRLGRSDEPLPKVEELVHIGGGIIATENVLQRRQP